MNLHGRDEPFCSCSCLYSILKGSPSSSHKWQRHFAVELSLSWRVCACYSFGTEIPDEQPGRWFLTRSRCTNCLPLWEFTLLLILRNGVLRMLSLILEIFWCFCDPKLVNASCRGVMRDSMESCWILHSRRVMRCACGVYMCDHVCPSNWQKWLHDSNDFDWFCKFGKVYEMGDEMRRVDVKCCDTWESWILERSEFWSQNSVARIRTNRVLSKRCLRCLNTKTLSEDLCLDLWFVICASLWFGLPVFWWTQSNTWQSGSIDSILDAFFGFLQRKTDFFTGAQDEQATANNR